MKRLHLLKAAKSEVSECSPVRAGFHEHCYMSAAFYTSRHAPFIMWGLVSQGPQNKGAWVRGSLPVQTPAPRQGGEGPFRRPASRFISSPLCASLSPLTKGGALPGGPGGGTGGPFWFPTFV